MRVCKACRRESEDAIDCPACGSPMRFSFPTNPVLPPDPSYPVPRPPHARRPISWWEKLISSPTYIAVIFVVVVAAVWGIGTLTMEDFGARGEEHRFKKIHVGMHVSEVGRILDAGPRRGAARARLEDYFDDDEDGDGTIEFEGEGVKLEIEYEDGLVTSIKERPAPGGGGMRRRQMIVRER